MCRETKVIYSWTGFNLWPNKNCYPDKYVHIRTVFGDTRPSTKKRDDVAEIAETPTSVQLSKTSNCSRAPLNYIVAVIGSYL